MKTRELFINNWRQILSWQEDYLDQTSMFANELREKLSPEQYNELSHLMRRQNVFTDNLVAEGKSKIVSEWYGKSTVWEQLVDFIEDEVDLEFSLNLGKLRLSRAEREVLSIARQVNTILGTV